MKACPTRKLGKAPEFTLLEVGLDHDAEDAEKETLWRLYTLGTEGFLCEIKEIFPDREMFSNATWLEKPLESEPSTGPQTVPVL